MPPTDSLSSRSPTPPIWGTVANMSTPDLPTRHSDDAHADSGAPTDAVTDDVREDAAEADQNVDLDDHTGDPVDADHPTGPDFPASEGHA
ncbi:hypothetical protein SRABI128_02824 [Microbacterium sp. Bi128]|nr:hypothetical protein SRABI128_02824 [Microbacterium sp. Bi128]